MSVSVKHILFKNNCQMLPFLKSFWSRRWWWVRHWFFSLDADAPFYLV